MSDPNKHHQIALTVTSCISPAILQKNLRGLFYKKPPNSGVQVIASLKCYLPKGRRMLMQSFSRRLFNAPLPHVRSSSLNPFGSDRLPSSRRSHAA